MKEDNRNLLLAITLSVVVLFGWQYFYGVPQMEKQQQIAQQNQQAQGQTAPVPAPGSAPAPAAVPGQTVAPAVAPATGVALTRDQALAQSPRVRIETPKIAGSIALTGARLDDVSLKAYRETVDPNSPIIVLLSPLGGPNGYYSDFGWVAGPGAAVALPNASTVWTADAQVLTPAKPLTLTWDNGQGLLFRRIVTVDDNAMFQVRDEVENKGAAAVTLFPYAQVVRHGRPPTLGYYVLHEGLIGVLGEQGLQEFTYDHVDKEPLLAPGTNGRVWKDVSGGFVGITDKYWAATVVPDQSRKYDGRFSSVQTGAARTYQADFLAEAVTLAPGASATSTAKLFAGAKEVAAINGYEQNLGIKRFDLLIDWGWFYFITKPMFFLLDWIFKHVGNFGVAILIVTMILKGLFFPLASKSYASMAKMKALQPEMLALRERYADDKMKQQQALMELYKTQKINPLAGCWPVLVQIPVFFALYKILFITIEMRHAPFFGWIRDLAAPDPTSIFNLFGLLPFAVPAFLLIGAWPILMGITMFIQMKMNPEPPDPIQKMMFTWMPVFFTFLLGSFPAGLVIYWTWNNLLSVLQQGYIMRKFGVKIELFDNIKAMFGKKPDPAAASVPAPGKPANSNKK
ncbi:MAG TPA: membrane protein insertase YidC [Bosea sp. (in: a-proteobacteria)]|uniref:membrane protein insertase YidC n=1 Tax=Bosea sp. (in: a-proteobacteria) TaxID=1871050 RepID=UPI002DDDA50F|nr:membrane protein insertase YidC [Bosea sp. (in: a-proteobacteria)]HEV2556668.1 membrane protein insertase YidC [Bosea sp. (in: a-proteobacteria)]